MRQFSNIGKTLVVAILGVFSIAIGFAQDQISDIDIDIDNIVFDKGPFYTQLWFWVVIGMVFLLLLIALIRGNGGKKDEGKQVDNDVE